MSNHVFHGAFVSGEPTIDQLAEHLPGATVSHRYGFAAPPFIKLANWRAVRKIADGIPNEAVLVGHSNGCLVLFHIIERMLETGRCPAAVICLAPAMRSDTVWPPGDYGVLCIRNPGDWVVETGRVWGRLFKSQTGLTHGWGAAGRRGFVVDDKRVRNWTIRRDGLRQHGLTAEYIDRIGPMLGDWVSRRVGAAAD